MSAQIHCNKEAEGLNTLPIVQPFLQCVVKRLHSLEVQQVLLLPSGLLNMTQHVEKMLSTVWQQH